MRALTAAISALLLAAHADAFTPAHGVRIAHPRAHVATAAVPRPDRPALSPIARVRMGERKSEWLDSLKKRGEKLMRDAADAAERALDDIDDGIDALLGPADPSAGLVPIPIPVPVDNGPYPQPQRPYY